MPKNFWFYSASLASLCNNLKIIAAIAPPAKGARSINAPHN